MHELRLESLHGSQTWSGVYGLGSEIDLYSRLPATRTFLVTLEQ